MSTDDPCDATPSNTVGGLGNGPVYFAGYRSGLLHAVSLTRDHDCGDEHDACLDALAEKLQRAAQEDEPAVPDEDDADPIDYEAHAEALWQYLDNIDTLTDVCKGDLAAFNKGAYKQYRKRFQHAASDGCTLTWLPAPDVKPAPAEALQDDAGMLHPLRDYEVFPVGFAVAPITIPASKVGPTPIFDALQAGAAEHARRMVANMEASIVGDPLPYPYPKEEPDDDAFRSGWDAARASMGVGVAETLREAAVGEWVGRRT